MRSLRNVFLTGLVAVLPAVITLYLLFWLAARAEAILGAGIRLAIPDAWYLPGMGVAAALALIMLVGSLADAWLLGSLLRLTERALERIPVVKTVFGGVRDLFAFVTGGKQSGLSRTVHVALTPQIGLIGFITREQVDTLTPADQREDRVAVYLPMSYQIGGYTVLVPRALVTPLDIPAQEALRLILTAGMTGPAQPGVDGLAEPVAPLHPPPPGPAGGRV